VDTVARLVPQLIKYGRIKQPGIAGASLVPDHYARRWDIVGVAVREVEPGSPADVAGLVGWSVTRGRRVRLGDVIVAVEGKPVRNQQDLFDALETAGVGTTVRLTVASRGGGGKRDVRVKLYDLR